MILQCLTLCNCFLMVSWIVDDYQTLTIKKRFEKNKFI